jgi:hypothetical protein
VAKVGIGIWKFFSIFVIIMRSLRNEIIWVDMFEKVYGRLGGIDEFGGSFVVVLLRFDVPIC